MSGRPDGQRAIVPGGTRGIGGRIAATLAEEGARVAILDRLAAERSGCARDIGGDYLQVDLTDTASAESATADAVGLLGGVDVLVNCAGIFSRTDLTKLTTSEWDLIFAINVRAMLITLQVAARTMIPAQSGHIVNLASKAAKKGGAHEAAYAANKEAVVALTRSAAHEWGVHGGSRPTRSARATCSPRWAPAPAPPNSSPAGRRCRRLGVSAPSTTSRRSLCFSVCRNPAISQAKPSM